MDGTDLREWIVEVEDSYVVAGTTERYGGREATY